MIEITTEAKISLEIKHDFKDVRKEMPIVKIVSNPIQTFLLQSACGKQNYKTYEIQNSERHWKPLRLIAREIRDTLDKFRLDRSNFCLHEIRLSPQFLENVMRRMNGRLPKPTESDNESAPSPVKSRPKVPYCKTYEQMRLEEIQAESAAYYSYEAANDAGLHLNQADVGKRIGANRWICPFKDKKEESAKGLDFKVLSLEEIRQRKREKELAAGVLTDTSGTEPPSPTEARGTKRHSIEQQCGDESVSPVKKRKTSSEPVKSSETIIKVPPVKLRRFLKSVTRQTETQPCKNATVTQHGTVGGQSNETSYRERLESHGDEPINVSRRSEVEVRLCDSSTNEKRTQTQPQQAAEDRKSVATYTTEDIMSSALLVDGQPYTTTEDEYLRLDTSSDDIMRDIEDLLK